MQALHEHIDKDGFRLRGTQLSRIDGFSDVVFGFALTLIVVSQAVPQTYDEFHKVLLGFYPFALCFLLFVWIWLAHYRFFRRYDLHDNGTIWINFLLLFTVLVYVYPLKFLFTIAAGHVVAEVNISAYQMRELMLVYGAGFATIYLCLAALYGNAWRQRRLLALTPLENAITLSSFWDYVGIGSFGLLCCLLGRVLPLEHVGLAPLSFFLIPIWKIIHGFASGRHIRAITAHTVATSRRAQPHKN